MARKLRIKISGFLYGCHSLLFFPFFLFRFSSLVRPHECQISWVQRMHHFLRSLKEVYHWCTRVLVQFYHVVSVKNVKEPSSPEAQQIPLITSLSPPSADLLHSLSFFPPYLLPDLQISLVGGPLGVGISRQCWVETAEWVHWPTEGAVLQQ